MNTNIVFRFVLALPLLICMSEANAWNLVYANDTVGNATYGSITTLINAIKQGHEVRVSQGGTFFENCAELFLNSDGSVTCTNYSNISNNSTVPGPGFGFQNDAYHWFVMINTKGQRDMSRWSVGAHVDRGHSQDTIAIQWFVD